MNTPKNAGKPAAARLMAEHPLVGAGLHYKNADGIVSNQAQIIAVFPSNNSTVGDLALVEYYEWISGGTETRALVALSELTDRERWVLYASTDHMNDHYQRVDQHQNRFIHQEQEAGEQSMAQPADDFAKMLEASHRALRDKAVPTRR
jgi:hypothetical protein